MKCRRGQSTAIHPGMRRPGPLRIASKPSPMKHSLMLAMALDVLAFHYRQWQHVVNLTFPDRLGPIKSALRYQMFVHASKT